MKSNKILVSAGVAVVFAVFNLLVFIFSPQMTPTFWVSYGFTVVAFALQELILLFCLQRKASADTVFYRIPILLMGFVYLALQVIVGSIFMGLPEIKVTWAIVVQVILLAMFALVAIAASIGNNLIGKADTHVDDKVMFIRLLESDVAAMRDKVTDSDTISRLEELQELIRYSDPMSSESLALVEQKIVDMTAQLSDAVDQNNQQNTFALISQIKLLLADRNRKCMILK